MTHLIPPTIPADEPSEGERLVIERLDTAADCSLLYVGCTRALHRLVILAHESLRGRFKLVIEEGSRRSD